MEHASPDRHILIVRKRGHARAAALALKATTWLNSHNYKTTVLDAGQFSAAYTHSGLCFALVFGGDGTILGVARQLVGRHVPICGVNCGSVGFLADAQQGQWEEKLRACLAGTLPVRSCMALRWTLQRKGITVTTGVAVNDVVVSRASLARLLNLGLSMDGRTVGCLRCDAVIMATPVGSSGYNASAGGPILHPCMNAFTLTPASPYPPGIAPLVVSGKTVCAITILQGRSDCCLTIDGQEGQLLETGDVLTVMGIAEAVQFMGGSGSFFDHLRIRQVSGYGYGK